MTNVRDVSRFLLLPFLLLLLPLVSAQYEDWTSDDLELFDLVEAVNHNFYEFIGVEPTATRQDIKKAYRRLSLIYHPDRNQDDNATTVFRNLASINDVLRNDDKRAKYDQVLEFGLPDWRQPIFYYRNLRKMSNTELFFIVVLIACVMQYLMMWGAYFERTLVIGQGMNKVTKRLRKQIKDDAKFEAALEEEKQKLLPEKPRAAFLFPATIARSVFELAKNLPEIVAEMRASRQEAVVDDDEEEEKVVEKPVRAPRVYVEEVSYAMATNVKPVSATAWTAKSGAAAVDRSDAKLKEGDWTVDDLNLLVRLSTQKYPAGATNRWASVAEAMSRGTNEVIQMAARLKHTDSCDYKKLCASTNKSSSNNYVTPNPSSKFQSVTHLEPTMKDDDDVDDPSSWSTLEQRTLETALSTFPKTHDDRWTAIAAAVGSKSKEECMARFKQLALMIRQRKQGGGK